jgi:hypothetical protein
MNLNLYELGQRREWNTFLMSSYYDGLFIAFMWNRLSFMIFVSYNSYKKYHVLSAVETL